jgi:hypothetical protein
MKVLSIIRNANRQDIFTGFMLVYRWKWTNFLVRSFSNWIKIAAFVFFQRSTSRPVENMRNQVTQVDRNLDDVIAGAPPSKVAVVSSTLLDRGDFSTDRFVDAFVTTMDTNNLQEVFALPFLGGA